MIQARYVGYGRARSGGYEEPLAEDGRIPELQGMGVNEVSGGKDHVNPFLPQLLFAFRRKQFPNYGVHAGLDSRPVHPWLAGIYAVAAGISHFVGEVGGANQGFAGYTACPGAVAAQPLGFDDGDAPA